jgi:hypothetical protein
MISVIVCYWTDWQFRTERENNIEHPTTKTVLDQNILEWSCAMVEHRFVLYGEIIFKIYELFETKLGILFVSLINFPANKKYIMIETMWYCLL